jgi:hypothetical protein
MAKAMGISFNRVALLGRVVNDPVVNGEWITFNMKTIVPKQGADKSWSEAEVMVPLLTNDPRKVETITNFVQDERQLYVEGYIEAWDGGCGVFVTMVKLGSKTMYDPDAQNGGGAPQGKKNNFPG